MKEGFFNWRDAITQPGLTGHLAATISFVVCKSESKSYYRHQRRLYRTNDNLDLLCILQVWLQLVTNCAREICWRNHDVRENLWSVVSCWKKRPLGDHLATSGWYLHGYIIKHIKPIIAHLIADRNYFTINSCNYWIREIN